MNQNIIQKIADQNIKVNFIIFGITSMVEQSTVTSVKTVPKVHQHAVKPKNSVKITSRISPKMKVGNPLNHLFEKKNSLNDKIASDG